MSALHLPWLASRLPVEIGRELPHSFIESSGCKSIVSLFATGSRNVQFAENVTLVWALLLPRLLSRTPAKVASCMPLESKPTSEPIEADTLLPRPKGSFPLVVLAGLGIVVAIYLARDLLIPLVLAVLLALLLRPLLRRMQR